MVSEWGLASDFMDGFYSNKAAIQAGQYVTRPVERYVTRPVEPPSLIMDPPAEPTETPSHIVQRDAHAPADPSVTPAPSTETKELEMEP